ncbi:MAG: type II CAAX endopeptidase family protein [Bacteroidota bacterium]
MAAQRPNPWRQGLMIIAELVLYIFLFFCVATTLSGIIYLIDPSGLDSAEDILDNPYKGLLQEYVPLLIASLVALWIIHRWIMKRPIELTGFVRDKIGSGISVGGMMAGLMISFGFLVLWIFGGIRIEEVDPNLLLFVGFFLFFFVQSSFEEVVFRGAMIPIIESRSNVWIALFVSSLLFSVVHGSNPNVNLISLVNIGLAGILMGMLFIRYRSIWPAIGLHAFWNFLQGSFYGFEVSGYDVYSLLDTTETGIDLWTGGSFGYEGSLLGSFSLIAAGFWVWHSKPEAFATLEAYKETPRDHHPISVDEYDGKER